VKGWVAVPLVAIILSLSIFTPRAEAQQAGKVHRIGFLHGLSAAAISKEVEAFRQGLRPRSRSELDNAFLRMTREAANAVFVHGSSLTWADRDLVAQHAVKNRLPTVCAEVTYVEGRCLMSYGTSFRASFRRAAFFVDKMLKGANPADLPVEQSTKFDLVINLRTAKALGLTIPPSLLLRADQVIE
jgi:putative ABC transport system substrate-binding protein